MKTRFALFALTFLAAPFAFSQGEQLGTVKATTKMRPDGTTATTVVDPEKKTAEETISTASGKMIKKTVFPLDERNFATGAIHYDAKGNIRYKEQYKHDTSDRVSESTLYSPTDQLLGRRVFTYDSKGTAHIDDYDARGVLLSPPQPTTGPSPSRGRPDKKK